MRDKVDLWISAAGGEKKTQAGRRKHRRGEEALDLWITPQAGETPRSGKKTIARSRDTIEKISRITRPCRRKEREGISRIIKISAAGGEKKPRHGEEKNWIYGSRRRREIKGGTGDWLLYHQCRWLSYGLFVPLMFDCCSIVVRLLIEQQSNNRRTRNGHKYMLTLTERKGVSSLFTPFHLASASSCGGHPPTRLFPRRESSF